jgi:hypothetical protein
MVSTRIQSLQLLDFTNLTLYSQNASTTS